MSDRPVATGPVTGLAPPHGGHLVDLVVAPHKAVELTGRAVALPNWFLTDRQLCDLELLACGAFSPLRGFLGQRDHHAVCDQMRLADGTLWPVPVCLDVDDPTRSAAERCGALALRDDTGRLVAVLAVEEAWRGDHRSEAEQVFGTADAEHSGVEHLVNEVHPWYLAGRLDVLALPHRRWPAELRPTPRALRERFAARGIERVVAFNTRNPMHRAHQELTLRAVRDTGAHLLIHPVVGPTQPGDVDPATRVACYRQLLPGYPEGQVTLALLPLAMRMAGPREALWHAIVRQNFGATHMIIGRDHAGPRRRRSGRPFYPPTAAQELVARHAGELRLSVLAYPELGYLPRTGSFALVDEVSPGTEVRSVSGTEVRRRLARGEPLPAWFTTPPVAAVLRRRFPPLARRGVTVFLTGLSGAGKSTIAAALEDRLQDLPDGRRVTLVDGDVARRHLSRELGYSRLDRDENVRRIGYLASEVTKHGGVAVCAVIAPYGRARSEVRAMVEAYGGFLLVHVATPLEVCASRDPKGLYASARAGRLPGLTGVADPYERPDDADLAIDTTRTCPEAAADVIAARLAALGYLAATGDQAGA